VAVIDVHAHVMVPEVDALVAGHPDRHAEAERLGRWMGAESGEHNRTLGAGYVRKFGSTETRLADMDTMGVDIQVLSTSPTQYHYWAEAELAAPVVEAANAAIAAMVAANPGHFLGFGGVALQHPALAVRQLSRAVEELGLKGAEICTRIGDRELDDPAHGPFWAAAERLGAVIFIHPMGCTLGERLADYYLGNVIGNPAETTVALSRLIFSGVLERHPGLRIVAAHGGGYLPFYIARSDHGWHVRPEARKHISRPPSEYLRRMWFDALVYEGVQVRHLVEMVGADRVVLGTDYPFDMGVTAPLETLRESGLEGAAIEAIQGGNAARLFSL
jgi:aminocarboxymuconate-semialdehyde decarboxylase